MSGGRMRSGSAFRARYLVSRIVAVAEGLSGGLVEIRDGSAIETTGGGGVVEVDPVELAGPPGAVTLQILLRDVVRGAPLEHVWAELRAWIY
jgi:hypothetical protein